ncbi:uncharacterized protein LOC130998149 [Salvia miltiorrhiza]|uniref:uncharacterized protein LOC130998149 n=1 Tax=Salvia miltiorrhiza TaxID=226208 RepID=UPI0025AD1148|nr:uncharacterized protein LOC130998149 [Salvia miltiorrhiza]
MSHDARGRDSLTPLQICTVAIRQLATGVSADTFDEYLKVADTIGHLCLKRFCKTVIRTYETDVAGSNNDINVLNQSSLFSDVLDGTMTPMIFETNQRYYQMGYYLCDDICPEWRCFLKSPPMVKELPIREMKTQDTGCLAVTRRRVLEQPRFASRNTCKEMQFSEIDRYMLNSNMI